MEYDYRGFLNSPTKDKWKRIGVKRRSGILVPLFSIYSDESVGIGEFLDIKYLIDWAKKVKLSIIQFLPLNDTGFRFTPYDSQSSFALDFMYLSIKNLTVFDEKYKHYLENLKNKLKKNKKYVNYKIKEEKLKILWKIFLDTKDKNNSLKFKEYIKNNEFWIYDYAVYKVLKDKFNQSSWEDWEEKYKYNEDHIKKEIIKEEEDRICFYMWLQWEAYLQLKSMKEYAEKNDILLMGDLPFLVSRDSADVWANQRYFKLNLSAGAPPDMYFAKGQRWGMPPYNWDCIKENNYDYIREKLKYAENFYHLYRIDHFIGLFRVWTIDIKEPEYNYGLNGKFYPEDENKWKDSGREILEVMLNSTDMLPCAEDLGTVPECSFEIIDEYKIPGTDVLRWKKDWGNTNRFLNYNEYRKNSIAVISTHDTTPLISWLEYEIGTVDEIKLKLLCYNNNLNFEEIKYKLFDTSLSRHNRLKWKKINEEEIYKILNKNYNEIWFLIKMYQETYFEEEEFLNLIGIKNKNFNQSEIIEKTLYFINKTVSIFSIQLIFDYLALGSFFDNFDKKELRINYPGIISEKNWTLKLPFSVNELLNMEINKKILEIHIETER